jgi:hypothetical protein
MSSIGTTCADHGLLADPVQPVAKPDRGRRLALARRRRIDRRHEDQLAIGAALERADEIGPDLRLVMAVGHQRLGRDAKRRANVRDRFLFCRAGDLDVGWNGGHACLSLVGLREPWPQPLPHDKPGTGTAP